MAKLFDIGDIISLLHFLMPANWVFALVRLYGRALYYVCPKDREIVRHNIAEAFADRMSKKDIDDLTRQFFVNEKLRAALLVMVPQMSEKQFNDIFPTIKGLNILEEAFAQEKGVIILASHLNSIGTFAAITLLRKKGYNVTVAMPKEGDPYAPTLFKKFLYKIFGDKPTFPELTGCFYAQFNVRPIVKQLTAKAAVVLVGDGEHSVAFEKADFLNHTLLFSTASVNIARSIGCPIIPLFVNGNPPDKLEFIIERPINQEQGKAIDDPRVVVSKYAKRLEAHLCQSIPNWQHWRTPRLFASMKGELNKSLEERYKI